MEFVEGETLESLILRLGRLEVKLALEIAMQVAAGLAAVHKENLVHRDIKPSNIMVSSEEGGIRTAKIFDLGLAKTVGDSTSESVISMPGGFAGTPEFASPEQFAGVGVDIRSDLYSLGVTLWEMLTGRTPFRGSPAEVRSQQQRATLPLQQVEDVPQPEELGTRSGAEEGRKLLEDAVAAFRSALEVRTKADLLQDWVKTQNNLSDALEIIGNQLEGQEGLKRKRESVELLREVVSNQPDDLSRYRLASALGDLAFNMVLNGQFAEAQTRCEEAQRLADLLGDGVEKTDRDNLVLIQKNLAHAVLFEGHYDKALAIYCEYWDKPLKGKTFGEVTLEDFAAFDKAGLTNPDLFRMKQELRDFPAKAPSP
jgi:serine/threonine protein kinase